VRMSRGFFRTQFVECLGLIRIFFLFGVLDLATKLANVGESGSISSSLVSSATYSGPSFVAISPILLFSSSIFTRGSGDWFSACSVLGYGGLLMSHSPQELSFQVWCGLPRP